MRRGGAPSHGELLGAMGAFDLSLRRVGFDVGLMLKAGHHREEITG
jgi:hypothetical protein